jgi:putative ABC transport system permease protein
VWIIVREGLALTAFGLVIGLGVAGAAGRGLSSLLYRISPLDAMTFAGTALLIGGGALLTTYVAALRRAVSILLLSSGPNDDPQKPSAELHSF